MPAKKATPRTRKPATIFDKYGGALKLFANYGAAGLFAGWLLIFTIPESQKSHNSALEKITSENREDRKAAFEHGEKAVERIAISIDGLRGTFGTVQGVTQSNQKEMIRLQSRTVELLEESKSKQE